jgi:hypothetical protein
VEADALYDLVERRIAGLGEAALTKDSGVTAFR